MNINGVPFILRKKFHPLPPFEFRQLEPPPNNIDSYEYDFTFERDTISSAEKYHEEKDKLEQVLAERRARRAVERKKLEEERKKLEDEQKRLDEEKRRQAQDEEEERLALTFPVSLAPSTNHSQNAFIPHLPLQPWSPPSYYHPPPTSTTVPLLVDQTHPLPLTPWRDHATSHPSSSSVSLASTPSFISTQFPFLSRFARTNRYDN